MRRSHAKLLVKQTLDDVFDQLLDRFVALNDAIGPTHGRVTTPKSRATLLTEEGKLGDHDGIDSGKGFPGTTPGWQDPHGVGDAWAGTPPEDGKICSAGHGGARALLDDPNYAWHREPVTSGSNLTVNWDFSMPHKTRRFTYWLTKDGWDDSQPLAREHLDLDNPVHEVINTYVPYYGPDAEKELMVKNPTEHKFTLPQRSGHHVLLGVWNVADTPAAFYLAADLQFP